MIVHESNILQVHVKCYAAYFDYVKVFEPHSQPIHIAESTNSMKKHTAVTKTKQSQIYIGTGNHLLET